MRISFTPRQSVGSGASSTSINAFHIEVVDLPGEQDWTIRFRVSGLLGQGPKRAHVEARNDALRERLKGTTVTAEVEAVSAPTTGYVTVAYEAWRKTLTYTDDVAPRRIPAAGQFGRQLALAARLATINEQVNSA